MAGLVLLSWAWPVAGGEKQNIQSIAVPMGFAMEEMRVTPGGIIHVEGLSAVYMMLSDNPLTAGRITVTGNFNGELSLNGVGSGSAIFEGGAWDSTSGTPVFNASADGGLWEGMWEHKGILGGAITQHKAVGHGVAGEVQGMVYAVEGQTVWNDEFDMYVTVYTGWLLDPKN
ncbi:MAG TPA: hypothetical protein VJA21_14795 [Verrucomicrobiae bacterium]